MAPPPIVLIQQLVGRLENATTSERLDALQELQILARSEAKLVGTYALQKVLDFLKDQGSAEEYQEALDLIDRLIKNRDKEAALANTEIVLAITSNVELLLDLLEHKDATVGVMTSQILTEVHANDPIKLESCIQDCPAGMNKLLQRLPDSSREEVRNQAIVLVQQLTMHNEEMKKTVVFNEGFEILFGIIRSEGGAADAGLVIHDCLQICTNILHGSETCQRLFFGMGTDWILKLGEFFEPTLCESYSQAIGGKNSLGGDLDGQRENSEWYDVPNREGCATLALDALTGALSTANPKHQATIALSTFIVPAAAFWIARKGPRRVVSASLSLLERVVEGNTDVASAVASMVIKVPSAVSGKTVPEGIEMPALIFGWRPLPTDDRRMITIPSLLAERYVFSCHAWSNNGGMDRSNEMEQEGDVSTVDGLSQRCLQTLEIMLSADSKTCDLMVQFILAPPPPSMDEDDMQLESMRPLGSILMNLLVEGCVKVLAQGPGAMKCDLDAAERAANVLSLLFISGGQLARELSTAISTSHTSLKNQASGYEAVPTQPLLPFLLSAAGRAARMGPVGGGYGLLVAILRLLSTVASGCNLAARQMLDDPSNFFVVDLASTASENAGVSPLVQVAACFFLGTCFQALEDPSEGKGEESLTRRSFVGMIDSRIGLNRLNDVLRRPLPPTAGQHRPAATIAINTVLATDLLFSRGFRVFYETQVEGIRQGMFEFYAGSATGSSKVLSSGGMSYTSAMGEEKDVGEHGVFTEQQEMIESQQQRILSLEAQLEALNAAMAGGVSGEGGIEDEATSGRISLLEQSLQASESKCISLQALLEDREADLESMVQSESIITEEASKQRHRAEHAEQTLAELQAQQVPGNARENDVEIERMQEEMTNLRHRAELAERSAKELLQTNTTLSSSMGGGDDSEMMLQHYQQQLIALKENILGLDAKNQQLQADWEQRGRKIDLLEEELRGPVATNNEQGREKKMIELEQRNAELKRQLWEAEAELEQVKTASSSRDDTNDQPHISSGLDHDAWHGVTTSAMALFTAIGADESMEICSNHGLGLGSDPSTALDATQNQSHMRQQAEATATALKSCGATVSYAVNEMSDIANSMGLSELGGDEGSITRLRDCLMKISEQHTMMVEKVHRGDNMRMQLEDAYQDLQIAEDKRFEVEQQMYQMEEELSVMREEKQALDEATTAAQEEIAAVKQELALVKEEMIRTNEAMVSAQEEAAMANEKISTMKEAMVMIEAERDALAEGVRNSLEALEVSHAHEAAQESALIHEHEIHETDVVEIETLKETVRSLEEKLLSTTAISNNDDEMDALRESYEAKVQSLEEQLRSVTYNNNNNNDALIQSYEENIKALEEKLLSVTDNNNDNNNEALVQSYEENIQVLEENLLSMEMAMDEKENECEVLQRRLDEMKDDKKANDINDSNSPERKMMNLDPESLMQQIGLLQGQIYEQQQLTNEKEEQYQQATEVVRTMEEKIALLQAQIRDQQQSSDGWEGQDQQFMEDRQLFENEKMAFETEKMAYENEARDLREECDALQEQLAQVQQHLSEQRKLNTQVTEQILMPSVDTSIAALQEQLSLVQSELADQKLAMASVQAQLLSTENDLQLSVKEEETLRQQLEEMYTSEEELRDKLILTEETIQSLRAEMLALQSVPTHQEHVRVLDDQLVSTPLELVDQGGTSAGMISEEEVAKCVSAATKALDESLREQFQLDLSALEDSLRQQFEMEKAALESEKMIMMEEFQQERFDRTNQTLFERQEKEAIRDSVDDKVRVYGEELKEEFVRELLQWEERVDGLEKELEASNSLVELMEAQVNAAIASAEPVAEASEAAVAVAEKLQQVEAEKLLIHEELVDERRKVSLATTALESALREVERLTTLSEEAKEEAESMRGDLLAQDEVEGSLRDQLASIQATAEEQRLQAEARVLEATNEASETRRHLEEMNQAFESERMAFTRDSRSASLEVEQQERAVLASATAEIESLRIQAEQFQMSSLAAEEALRQEEVNRDSLTTLLQEANTANATYIQENALLRTSIDGLREELVGTRSENDRLQQNLRLLQTESVSLAGQSELILEQKSALEDRVHALNAILTETMEEAEHGRHLEVTALKEQHHTHCEVLHAKISSLEQETLSLRAQLHHAHTAHNNERTGDALGTMQQEVQRLSCEVERLMLDLNLKDADLHDASLAAQKREGELAGVRAILDGLTDDVNALRHENDDLATRLGTEVRRNKELQREHGRGGGGIGMNNQTTSSFEDAGTRSSILELLSLVESKCSHYFDQNTLISLRGNNKQTSVGGDNNHHWTDAPLQEVVEHCRMFVGKALKVMEDRFNEMDGGVNNMRTNGPSSLLTPARPTPANAFVAAMTVHAGGTGNTPGTAGKEATRLLLEINKERRRLAELQEQHGDLLGLLAQQEVELSVFRGALLQRLGENAVQDAQDQAQLASIKKYGTYTNFRHLLGGYEEIVAQSRSHNHHSSNSGNNNNNNNNNTIAINSGTDRYISISTP